MLELIIPEFSSSKLFAVRPDIVDILADENKPVYDMILGTETMAKMGVVLDFQEKSIAIDQISLKMKDLINNFLDSKSLNNLFKLKEQLEPSSAKELTVQSRYWMLH